MLAISFIAKKRLDCINHLIRNRIFSKNKRTNSTETTSSNSKLTTDEKAAEAIPI